MIAHGDREQDQEQADDGGQPKVKRPATECRQPQTKIAKGENRLQLQWIAFAGPAPPKWLNQEGADGEQENQELQEARRRAGGRGRSRRKPSEDKRNADPCQRDGQAHSDRPIFRGRYFGRYRSDRHEAEHHPANERGGFRSHRPTPSSRRGASQGPHPARR